MKLLAHILLTFLACFTLHGQIIFREDFDSAEFQLKNNFVPSTENPPQGKACAHIIPQDPKSPKIALVEGTNLLPVKPDTWYRFSFLAKNTIGNGEFKYGFNESRSAEKLVSEYYSWQWRALPLNMTEWTRYTGEFHTAKTTQAIKLYIRTETTEVGSGAAWFDDLTIEEFIPAIPPLAIAPYDAAASYTDIPTRQAYTIPKDRKKKLSPQKMQYLWQDLDLANLPLEVTYTNLPQNTQVSAELIRGKNTLWTQKRTLTGSGVAKFNIGLNTLPEGIYLFRVSSQTNGKTTCTCEKELWRIKQADIRMPKLEPITSVTLGPDRYRLINGKHARIIHGRWTPASGILHHIRQNCKPNADTYLDILQEQFGANMLMVWSWRARKWNDNLPEYYKLACREMKEWMDLAHKHNYCCHLDFEEKTEDGRRLPSREWLTAIISHLKTHPALLEWSLDEPEIPKYKPEDMIERTKWIKELDTTHPVNVNLCQKLRFNEYAPCSDVGSLDVYPFPGASLIETDNRMQKLVAAYPTAPIYEYLQYFNFKDLPMPNFDEVRGTFILDRIYGSHDLVFYSWGEGRQSILTDMELQAYFRAIYAMYMKYEDFLDNATVVPLHISSSTRDVRSIAVQNGSETAVLIVNLSKDTPAKVSFKTNAKTIEHFMDNTWTYPIVNGEYTTELPPNGTRFLKIK